jgi:hypothetical protein
VQVFRCSVEEAHIKKRKREMRETGRREKIQNIQQEEKRKERYVCMSKRVREKILLLRL